MDGSEEQNQVWDAWANRMNQPPTPTVVGRQNAADRAAAALGDQSGSIAAHLTRGGMR